MSKLRIAALAALALAGAAALLLLPWKDTLLRLVEWARGAGPAGPLVLAAAYVPASLLFVPGSLLTLGAGFAFGVVVGTAAVSAGSVLGASAAFLAGRTLARDWVRAKVEADPRFKAIERAVAREGFKIVLLTRLSPAFPFNLLNYAYGVTPVRFLDYVLASWIGMLPGTLLYVYLGSAVGSVAELAAGGGGGGTVRTALFVAGLVATGVVALLVTRVARRALREAVPGHV